MDDYFSNVWNDVKHDTQVDEADEENREIIRAALDEIVAGIIRYLQEEIEIFLNEANEVEHLRMGFGEVLGPHESKLPEYLEYDDFVEWEGNKKTLKGLNDNKFGDHLL